MIRRPLVKSNSDANTAVFAAAKTVPASPAMPAPQANAISFSRFTGIPISSAARGSSRSDFHARPVRDRSTRYIASSSSRKMMSAT